MVTLKVKKAFSWAYQNVHIKDHAAGEVIETDDKDLIRVSTEEGWAKEVKAPVDSVKQDLAAPDQPAADPLVV